jgi:hypothetical protein
MATKILHIQMPYITLSGTQNQRNATKKGAFVASRNTRQYKIGRQQAETMNSDNNRRKCGAHSTKIPVKEM